MKKEVLKSLLLITIGSAIFAATINMLLIPNHMGEGGVTGVTLLMYYVMKWDPAVTGWIINAILLVIGWRFLERQTLYYTIVTFTLISIFIAIFDLPVFIPENSLVVALLSGVLMGVAIGLVVLAGGTTAGGDIIVMIMNKYLGIPVPTGFLIVDAIIVSLISMVIGLEKAVITLLMIVIFTKVMEFILEGFNPRKSVMIISPKTSEIAEEIATKMDRGVTMLKGYGYYTKQEKDILYVIVIRNQIVPIQKITQAIDPEAFIIISDVHQVHGEGFSFHKDEPLTLENQ